MRIALLNLDCTATQASTREFIARHAADIVLVALSPAFRPQAGGVFGQSRRHMACSGMAFSNFLAVNFLVPRLARRLLPGSDRLTAVCGRHGIRVMSVPDVKDANFVGLVRDLGVDLIVTSFFDQILSPELIAVPALGAVNVHIAPLPDHRGPMPVIHGLLRDPPRLGVSVHRMESGIDTGPVLMSECVQPASDASVLSLIGTLQSRGMDMVSELIPAIAERRTMPIAQAGGSYQSFPTRADIAELLRGGRRLYDWSDLRRAMATACEP